MQHNNPASPRHFLFLQGMPGPFFRRVGDALEEHGHRVSRINLCFADWLFWHDRRATSYRGRATAWESFIATYLGEEQVTDLVLLGEKRRYHREAIAQARRLGVRVMVTDFGYLRPDWITLEENGMSGESTLPRTPEGIAALDPGGEAIDTTPVYRDSTWGMASRDVVGSLGNVLFRLAYPFYVQSDERPHPLIYFPAMGWRMLGQSRRDRQAARQFEALRETMDDFFVFPLQLDHDFQIRAYSPFSGLGEVIDHVLSSFARHAPERSHLVIKSHPWDPGLTDWEKRVGQQARRLGIADRIHYLDGGDLDAMMSTARGVVTVNSTAGLQALRLGLPTKVLGQAIYDIATLTSQAPLGRFWSEPTPPDPARLEQFLRVLVQRTQVRGVFFGKTHRDEIAAAFARRLMAASAASDRSESPAK